MHTMMSTIGRAKNTDCVALEGKSLGSTMTNGSSRTVCDKPRQNVVFGWFIACRVFWQTNCSTPTKKTMNERRTKGTAKADNGTLPRTRLTIGAVKNAISTQTANDQTSVDFMSIHTLAKARSGWPAPRL